MKQRILEYINLLFFVAATIALLAMDQDIIGLSLAAIGLLCLTGCSVNYRSNVVLLYISLLVLYFIPIGTTTALPQSLFMGLGLAFVVLMPYVVTKYVYKNNLIRFPSLHDKNWTWHRTAYLLGIAVLSYLLIPFMLRDTNSYVNWDYPPDFWSNVVAYLGLNAVGIWDELFFVCTTLAILRNFFPFALANIAQAVIFTSFLYVLAFKGWSVPVIFIFALLQGYAFQATKSLLFILAIHLTIDLVLHFAILHLHYPELFPYFIT